MTYEAFLENLNARGMFHIHPSLGRVRKVLAALGNPQDRWPSIHIAGTNGKGSVAAALESVLRASGYRTGFYMSPHLVDLRERIQIHGRPLVKGFATFASDVLQAERRAKTPLTYFELLTAIAFHAFAQKKIDIAIVECGLGGRWDATNTLKQPLAAIITSIGLDHTEWLGADEFQIAAQKAGIIKSRGFALSGVQGGARNTIAQIAREKHARISQLGADFRAEPLTTSWLSGKQWIRFHHLEEPPQTVPFGLLGSHQVDNAAVVMETIRHLQTLGWHIPAAKRDAGLSRVHWPGRMQLLQQAKGAPILMDGAHNPAAMKKLIETIESSPFKNVPKTFVFSAFKDKDYLTMARMITRLAAEVCLCPLPSARGEDVHKLQSAFEKVSGPVRTFHVPVDALENALRDTPGNGLVVVTGSLALVGEILRAMQPRKREMAHV